MASDKQIQANRLNAQKSTGPQSPEGKQRVAQNRTKHGLAGQHVVLPGEDQSSFDDLLATLNSNWDPHGETETFLVDTMAFNQWRLIRIGRMEHASLLRKHQSQGALSLTMEVEDLSRYEGRASRAYYRAANMLMKLQAARQKGQQQQQVSGPPEEEISEGTPPPRAGLTRTKGEGSPANQTVRGILGSERGSNPTPPGQPSGQPPLPDAA